MHVDVLNLVFDSLVENVFYVLLALLVSPVVLEFVGLWSDPDVNLWEAVKHIYFVGKHVVLLKSRHLAHGRVTWIVGYLKQTGVEVVHSFHFFTDILVVTFTAKSTPEIVTLVFFLDLNSLSNVMTERFNQV
jgi:hypothetical protein